ncbi:hypothetical protein WR25_11388 [Diploscapter pachys]|uniref:Nuclear receptor domain-containing protein n=1 Tax=Diploscapter pachys TaxID=2018661 RepID=A0A2A2L332_9BILA|nr:hypothetical protein WR25_11388 [Diploscapter pachys]
MSVSEQSNAEINLIRKNSINGMKPSKSTEFSNEQCRVCGDGNAKMHYGVITCFGCKGFFRRTLKRPAEYSCRHNGTCVVDRHERNSCRYCRFQKCLMVGMDPKAVRPDRDATGRHYQGRQRRSKLSADDEGEIDSEWTRKLPVDMRTTLMQLLNVDLIVSAGDGTADPKTVYPLPHTSIRHLLEDPSLLDGKRSEMRYDSYREVDVDILPIIAHRCLIAMIDWADHLFDMMDLQNLDDKAAMVKAGFAPLTVFSFCSNTARTTKQPDIISLNTFGFLKRETCRNWSEPYHFANRLADRCLDDLIEPLRKMALKDEEVTLLKAIVILNPHRKQYSQEASEAIADLRDRVQETLYHVVRETHPKEVASSRFGNLLLFVPSVMMLGNVMMENLTFVDSFGSMTDRLMHDLLQEDFVVDQCKQEVTLVRRLSEPRMLRSSPSSSVESLHSHSSNSSVSSYPQQMQPNLENGQPQGQLPYNLSSNSLPGTVSQFDLSLNSAASMPNLEMQDCDPDYNVTLTPDMFSDMRQAMSQQHQQQMDTGDEYKHAPNGAPNLAPRRDSMPASPTDTPMFYISTVESTKHKFTVTTQFNYPNQQQGAPNGAIMASCTNGGSNGSQNQPEFTHGHMSAPQMNGQTAHMGQAQMGHHQMGQPHMNPQVNQQMQMQQQQQQQQQPLCKTNSLPAQYYQQMPPNTQPMPYPPNGVQQMEYENSEYYG